MAEDTPGGAEEPEAVIQVEVTMATLDELLGAWGTCVGANVGPPGVSAPDAMGLILSYLPAVLEMARAYLEAATPTTRLSRSGHRLFDSGYK